MRLFNSSRSVARTAGLGFAAAIMAAGATTAASSSQAEAACGRDGDKLSTSAYGSSRAGAGSVWFECEGDLLYLCDHQEDGRSVLVELNYLGEDLVDREYDRWNWWGPYKYGGCKTININALEGSTVGYRVCLGVHGHPGGTPGDRLEGSCSRWGGGIA
jgi:hypothetical protein